MNRGEAVAYLIAAGAAACMHFSHLQVLNSLPGYTDLYHNKRLILNPGMAKCFTLGYDRFLADIFWLSFVQYYGDWKACGAENYRYAPAYLRLIISLDPHFVRPYWFCAFVLAGDMGQDKREAAAAALTRHDSQEYMRLISEYRNSPGTIEAKKILDEGIKNNPGDWGIPYITGFSQYLFSRDYKEAARYYRIAARVPGAPAWLEKMAEVMDSGISSLIKLDAASWRNTYESAEDPSLKERARYELQKIWSQVYYHAPNQRIKDRAIEQLKSLELDLLPLKGLPLPSSAVGEDF